jgi:hypothetical protein
LIVNTNEKNKTVHSIAELVAFINRDDAIVIAVILQRLGLFYFAFFTEKEQIKNELGTGVYLFIDNYQVISYVGKADEMKSRIRNGHEKLENEEIITINTWDIVIAGRLEIILERLLLPGKNRTVPGTIPGRRRK